MTTAADPATDNVVGNFYDKYRSKNPIERALVNGFLGAVSGFFGRVAPATVLEVGCGEGRLAQHLVTRGPRPRRFVACDLELSAIAPGLDPLIELRQASIYELPFEDRSFDLVVCCEVLEHLHEPARGLAEVARVARRAVIVSTPREPLWRAMNMMRGKYLRDLGNTPGHVQHFGPRSLVRLVESQLRVAARKTPLPWTVILGERDR
ncbi:MAG TPA: methyltransferase domain-containing protein [Polyangiaceae bacterium]|jgi:ubiquinone/menaquinone biosynthesis C-methylase UbiE|nr:methyltransferase domain-containing protein [Polyangiaceae bacterium]